MVGLPSACLRRGALSCLGRLYRSHRVPLRKYGRLPSAQWHLSSLKAQHRSLHTEDNGDEDAPTSSTKIPWEELPWDELDMADEPALTKEPAPSTDPAPITDPAWLALNAACMAYFPSDDT